MDELQKELKTLIIESLRIDGLTVEEISDSAALFGKDGGLGLDSLDALELVVALEYRYGFRLELEQDEARKVFANINSLSEYVRAQRTK